MLVEEFRYGGERLPIFDRMSLSTEAVHAQQEEMPIDFGELADGDVIMVSFVVWRNRTSSGPAARLFAVNVIRVLRGEITL